VKKDWAADLDLDDVDELEFDELIAAGADGAVLLAMFNQVQRAGLHDRFRQGDPSRPPYDAGEHASEWCDQCREVWRDYVIRAWQSGKATN